MCRIMTVTLIYYHHEAIDQIEIMQVFQDLARYVG